MHKGTYFALAAITVVGGFALGRAFKSRATTRPTAAPPPRPRRRPWPPAAPCPATSIASGCRWRASSAAPADALVNIVVFSDFQCPFCGRVNPTLEKLIKDYAGQGAGVLQALPAALPPGRAAGLAGGAGRRRPGQVLGDARQAVRQPAGAEAARPRPLRQGAGPGRGQVQAGAGQQHLQGPHRRRHGPGQPGGRQRHPGLVHQRPPGRRARSPTRSSRRSSTRRSPPPTSWSPRGRRRPGSTRS